MEYNCYEVLYRFPGKLERIYVLANSMAAAEQYVNKHFLKSHSKTDYVESISRLGLGYCAHID